MFVSRILAAGSLVASVSATFSILAPGGPDVWWVAQSDNTMVWTCHTDAPAQAYQILLNNTSQDILVSPMAILANLPNADCSHTIGNQQVNLKAATGYTLVLADPSDQNKIYATSQQFEVKALGAQYPATSATPTDPAGSTTPSASTTGSSGASPSGTSASSTKGSGAMGLTVSVGGMLLAAGAVLGML